MNAGVIIILQTYSNPKCSCSSEDETTLRFFLHCHYCIPLKMILYVDLAGNRNLCNLTDSKLKPLKPSYMTALSVISIKTDLFCTFKSYSPNPVIKSYKNFWVQRKFLFHILIQPYDFQKNFGANHKMVN